MSRVCRVAFHIFKQTTLTVPMVGRRQTDRRSDCVSSSSEQFISHWCRADEIKRAKKVLDHIAWPRLTQRGRDKVEGEQSQTRKSSGLWNLAFGVESKRSRKYQNRLDNRKDQTKPDPSVPLV